MKNLNSYFSTKTYVVGTHIYTVGTCKLMPKFRALAPLDSCVYVKTDQ